MSSISVSVRTYSITHFKNSPALTGTLRTTPSEIRVGSVIRTPKFKRKLNTKGATKEKSILLIILREDGNLST